MNRVTGLIFMQIPKGIKTFAVGGFTLLSNQSAHRYPLPCISWLYCGIHLLPRTLGNPVSEPLSEINWGDKENTTLLSPEGHVLSLENENWID